MASNRTLLLTGAGLVGGAVVWFSTGNPFETQGTRNIAERWSAGGGARTHTPAQATPRGRADLEDSPTGNTASVSSQHFADNIADQRTSKNILQQKFQEAQYGQSNGK